MKWVKTYSTLRYPAKRPTSYKPRPAYHERPAYNERPSYHSYAATPKPYAAYKPAYRQPYAPPYENRRPTSGAQVMLYVQEVLTHFIQCELLYKMGQDFLDIQ